MTHFLWDHYIRFNKINWKICLYLYAIQNKKMFQRVFIVFPWDYPTNYKLWYKIPHFQKSFSVSVNWSILQDKSEYLMSLSPHSFSTMFYHHRIDISGIHCLTKDCIFILSKILWLQYPKWEFKVSDLYFIVYHRESFAQKYFPVIHYFHLNAIMDVLNIKHIKHCYITADCAIALVLLIGHLLG